MCSIGTTIHSASRRLKAAGIVVKYSPSLRWLEQTNAGITSAQWTANLALKLVHRLDGVPAGRPEKWRVRRAAGRGAPSMEYASAESGSSRRFGFDDTDVRE